MNRARTSLAATGVAVIAAALTLARAWAESEHDPWLEACDDCGQVCPSPFGPEIVKWMVTHKCKGETS